MDFSPKGLIFSLALTLGLSLFVYAGASQFAAVSLISGGHGVLSTVLLTFILNLRHFLMNTTLAARIGERRLGRRALIAFGITDETFSVASFDDGELTTPFLLSLNITAYVAWVSSSAAGYIAGDLLPDTLQGGMGIALYAMFVGLLIPNVRHSPVGLRIVLMAMLLNTVAQRFLNPGLAIVVVALAVTSVATFLWSDDTQHEKDRVEDKTGEQSAHTDKKRKDLR